MALPEQVCAVIDDEVLWFSILADQNAGTIFRSYRKVPSTIILRHELYFCCLHLQFNVILLGGMPSRIDESMVNLFKDVYEYLKLCNFASKLYVLDNEYSGTVKKYIISKKSEIQLV